ncbi:MAG: TetR/AcrR family transcriptional regulator [Candidatus Dormibacteria bacterium]
MSALTGPDLEVGRYRHGRVPRAVRERQVIAAAEELFAEHGFAAASMDELCRRVGVSKPVVYGLVGSKEALYRRCVDRMADELAARIARAADAEAEPRAQVAAAALAFFRYVAERRRLWEALALDPGPFAADAAAMRDRQNLLVAALMTSTAERAGGGGDARWTLAVAGAVNGAIEALARWWRDHEDVTPEELTTLAVRLLTPGLENLLTP